MVEHPGAVGIAGPGRGGPGAADPPVPASGRQAALGDARPGLRDVAGEPLRATAERELLEEAGYRRRDWHVLVDYFSSPGISTERLRIFLARGLSQVPEAERTYVREHEEAHLMLAWVPLEEVVALLTRR